MCFLWIEKIILLIKCNSNEWNIDNVQHFEITSLLSFTKSPQHFKCMEIISAEVIKLYCFHVIRLWSFILTNQTKYLIEICWNICLFPVPSFVCSPWKHWYFYSIPLSILPIALNQVHTQTKLSGEGETASVVLIMQMKAWRSSIGNI